MDYSVALDKSVFALKGPQDPKVYPLRKMNQFISYIENGLNRAIELFDIFNEDGTLSNRNRNGSPATPAEPSNDFRKEQERMAALNFLQSLLNFFSFYMMKAEQPLNRETLRLLTHVKIRSAFVSDEFEIAEPFELLNSCVTWTR